MFFFFFQAEDGIRDWSVTGVQTCALPISTLRQAERLPQGRPRDAELLHQGRFGRQGLTLAELPADDLPAQRAGDQLEIGRASCRERSGGLGGGGISRKEKNKEG